MLYPVCLSLGDKCLDGWRGGQMDEKHRFPFSYVDLPWAVTWYQLGELSINLEIYEKNLC